MVEKFKAENLTQLTTCQTQLNAKETALNRLKLDNEAASNEKLALERKLNSQKLTIEKLQSEKESVESGSSYCNRQLQSKQSQIYSLESENRRLENSNEQCESDLQDQKTNLESALNGKRRIESQFNQQQSTINQLESEKEAAESQSSYCNRQLSGKRSEIYSLESENGRLENAEERCMNDLRYQKTSLTSIKERYNSLIKSINPVSAPSSIKVSVVSGSVSRSKKIWRDKNLPGSYHFIGIHNERPVFKRDKNTVDGQEICIYYHTNEGRNGWYISSLVNFQKRVDDNFISIYSAERDLRKTSRSWYEWDGTKRVPVAKVIIT